MSIPALTAGPHIGQPLRGLFEQLELIRQAVEAGGESVYYPNLFVDSDGYIAVDYGEVVTHGE